MNIEEQEKALIALLTRVLEAPLRPIRKDVSGIAEITQSTQTVLGTTRDLLGTLQAELKVHTNALGHLKRWQCNFDAELPQSLNDPLEALKAQLEGLQSELALRDQQNQATAAQARAAALDELADARAALSAAQQQNAATQRAEAQHRHRELNQALMALQAHSQQAQAASEAALSSRLQNQAASLQEALQKLLWRQEELHKVMQADLALQKGHILWAVALSGASLVACAAGIAAWALKLV